MVFNIRYGVILFLLFFSSLVSYSQKTTIQTKDGNYDVALDLFNKQKFAQAQNCFLKVIETKPRFDDLRVNAEFYVALCAYELFNDDAENLLILFAKNNSENVNARLCNFYVGNLYYRNRQFKQALMWYEKTQLSHLSNDLKFEYQFKKGYCYFLRNNYDKAKPLLAEVKDIDNKYAAPATYYYSHIAYTEKKYEIALVGFLKFKRNPTFGPIVPYYITQIYFLQGKYNLVIDYAKPILDSTNNNKRAPEIAHLIGDAYSKLGKYTEAIQYFDKFVKSNNPLYREDYYTIGYTYYKAKIYKTAIDYLKKAIPNNLSAKDDSLSQITYLNLADCYLQMGEKTFARNAFDEASKMNFDKEISENALYNYAKLSYETESDPYHDAIEALQKYVLNYPSSPNYDEAFKYLVNAYLASKNYKEALVSLDKMQNKSLALQNAYQRIAFTYGIDLYNNQDYLNAISLLTKSLVYHKNRTFNAEAHYWKGEAYYKLNNIDSALLNYKKFLYEPGAAMLNYFHTVNYNIGYCYFTNQNYFEAAEWFRKFLAFTGESDKKKKADAYLRVGDCFYVQKHYLDAIEFYESALNNSKFNSDYALYQKGMSLGVLDKLDAKIVDLKKLVEQYPKSSYLDNSLFEIGFTYLLKNDNSQALEYFSKLESSYPNSSLVKKSMLKKALIYYNTDKDIEAINTYKDVIKKYPNTEEANQSINALKNIYVELGNIVDFETFIQQNPTLSISDAALDSAEYEVAENNYTKGDCETSRLQFAAYLSKFSAPKFILNANYYKALCDLKAGESESALKSFNAIISQPSNKFSEKALINASTIYYKQEKFEDAKNLYVKLELIADNSQLLRDAQIGQMRCNFKLSDFDNAIQSANKLLESEKTTNEIKNECHLIKGKSYVSLNRDTLALRELNEVLLLKGTIMASEAKYVMAEYFYSKNDNAKSQSIIMELVNEDPGYDYWITKAFMLLSDNFVAIGDNFQAKETLQSIIDNSEDKNVVEVSKSKLQKILDSEKAIEDKFRKDAEEIKFDVQEVKDNEEVLQE